MCSLNLETNWNLWVVLSNKPLQIITGKLTLATWKILKNAITWLGSPAEWTMNKQKVPYTWPYKSPKSYNIIIYILVLVPLVNAAVFVFGRGGWNHCKLRIWKRASTWPASKYFDSTFWWYGGETSFLCYQSCQVFLNKQVFFRCGPLPVTVGHEGLWVSPPKKM